MSPVKTHETVMTWIRTRLSDGSLRIGDRLPGERQLAEQFGVSRGSVREALRILEATGVVTSATGSGPRAGTIVVAASEQALTLAFKLQLATQQVDFGDVVTTRLLLETWAAENVQPHYDHWEDAERLLDAMDDPGLPVPDFLTMDARFHAELSRAAGNPLISTLMEGLRGAIAERTLDRAEALPDWASASAMLRRQHRDILTAARSGDTRGAAQLVREHILGYEQLTSIYMRQV